MTALEIVRALGPIDARSVRRDPLLRWLIFYPWLVALIIHWVTPIVRTRLIVEYQFDLQPYYPLIMSFIVLMTPMLAGVVVGFLLLDQRDDQTLAALQVTPLTLNGYFAYRIAIPTVLSFLVNIAVFPLTGLLQFRTTTVISAAAGSCMLAPIYALALGAFARNKVQGFALSKALGILLVPPFIAYFVRPPWQWLFGLDPLYWPAKLVWVAESGSSMWWLYLISAFVVQTVLLRLLIRLLSR